MSQNYGGISHQLKNRREALQGMRPSSGVNQVSAYIMERKVKKKVAFHWHDIVKEYERQVIEILGKEPEGFYLGIDHFIIDKKIEMMKIEELQEIDRLLEVKNFEDFVKTALKKSLRHYKRQVK